MSCCMSNKQSTDLCYTVTQVCVHTSWRQVFPILTKRRVFRSWFSEQGGFLLVTSSVWLPEKTDGKKTETQSSLENSKRQAEHEWGGGKQSLRQGRGDKEASWPPVCLPLVLLLAPQLSATGRISLLIRCTRLQHHRHPLPLIVLSLMCPVWQTCALSHMNRSRDVDKHLLEVAFKSKGVCCLNELDWGGYPFVPSFFGILKCLSVIQMQDNQSVSLK